MNVKFWIQNISAEENDFMIENGKILEITDQTVRRSFVNQLLEIKNKAKRIVEKPDMLINESKMNRNHFLIELSAENKDENGRQVAVIILIEEYTQENKKHFHDLINKTFKITEPKTKISDDSIDNIFKIIDDYKKNNLRKKNITLITLIIILLIFLLKNLINLIN